MTSSNSELSAFRNLVNTSRVRQNRRDFLRISAVTAAAAVVPLGGVYARQDSTPDSTPGAAGDFSLRLPFNPYGQDVTTDPHRAVNWGPFWVMLPYAWSGLLRFDENGAVEADLAESVEPNEDGSVWTATLREGIAFADGTPITADHFIQSWHRALDSTRLSPMFRFMEPIVNAAERSQGENIELGVEVADERTLEISLTAPLAHFPSYLATFGFAVVHPNMDAEGDEALEPGSACSGPWMISSESTSEIIMVPNPHHWSEPSADVGEIVWAIAPGGNTDLTILEWYQANEIAVADAPSSILNILTENESPDLQRFETQSSTKVLALDFQQAPFNDVRVRRAIAASVDREIWSTEFQQEAYVPASSFSPPVLNTIANYQAPTDDYDEDPATLISDAGVNPEESDEAIVLFQPATDSPEEIERTAQLLSMISDATGLQITHDTALTAEQMTAARQDAGGLQMSLMQWQLSTDQPSLLSVMTQASEYNAGWVNWEPELEDTGDYTPGADAAAFDELVTTAQTTLDEAERNAAYIEAEQLLLKNAVLIPLGFWSPAYLQKAWLLGTRQGPWSGSTPVRIDAEVTVDAALVNATPASTPES